MKTSKHELVIATWPKNSGFGYFGDTDYNSMNEDTMGFNVCFRTVLEGDRYPHFDESVRALNNVVLYVWACTDGTVCIDLRVSGHGNHTLHELELQVKALKRLNAKAAKQFGVGNFVHRTTVYAELTKILDALGVKRSVGYHGIGSPESYEPIGLAIAKIADIATRRMSTMKQRQAA